ncbi:hypothetical protein MTYP_01603 [Methylophilaceae bacterium]|nr:hypothetical protein MTYP_01603 [Methylophilaceae bacterium]
MLLLICLFPAALSAPALCAAEQKITVYLTVDWEGWSLDDENLETIRAFRLKYPHIPMLHLLNPVYFIRQDADTAGIAERIRRTLLPTDTYGLHLHGWKSLVEKCKVPYKSSPSFAQANEECNGNECGYTVSLEFGYTPEELTQLVGCSAALLSEHGFGRPRHFRAGGWQLGPGLASALQANGFTWDSSRTDAGLIAHSWGEQSALVKMLRRLHPAASTLDQPRELLPGLMQYPNNASLADYTSTEQLVTIFRSLVEARKTVMVTGFHQETAFVYLDNLEAAIPLMEQEARLAGVQLEWGRYD